MEDERGRGIEKKEKKAKREVERKGIQDLQGSLDSVQGAVAEDVEFD